MDELRDKVAAIIRIMEPSEKRADRILALPEIAEALTKAKRWDEACMDALDD